MLNAWLKLPDYFSKIADCAFLAVPSVKTLSISQDDGKSLTQNDIKYFNDKDPKQTIAEILRLVA